MQNTERDRHGRPAGRAINMRAASSPERPTGDDTKKAAHGGMDGPDNRSGAGRQPRRHSAYGCLPVSNRQTDRQTDRQIDRQTDRQIDGISPPAPQSSAVLPRTPGRSRRVSKSPPLTGRRARRPSKGPDPGNPSATHPNRAGRRAAPGLSACGLGPGQPGAETQTGRSAVTRQQMSRRPHPLLPGTRRTREAGHAAGRREPRANWQDVGICCG